MNTVTQNPLPQTDETVETDLLVSNDDFLMAIFGLVSADALYKPLVCSKPADPDQGGWTAKTWPTDTSHVDLNWYATPALFGPNRQGQYRAQKEQAQSVHCLVLDDVGTKIGIDRLDACEPNWLIETSPQNHQAGYIFETPISDLQQADALKAALIAAGLCDAGASGAAARWMRLPRAINGKPKYGRPSPRCRLVRWVPELRYSVEALVLAFGLQPVDGMAFPPDNCAKPSSEGIVLIEDALGDVYTPKPSAHPVLAALKERGLYKAVIGPGKHNITCPWFHEHTDQIDHGTVYYEGSSLFPHGGFKCQHAHGDLYHLSALLDHLSVSPEAAQHRATIQVVNGELHRVVDAAERELAATGRYYQRGGVIVTVESDPATGDPTIQELTQAALVHALSRLAHWVRFEKRSDDYQPCDPPSRHVSVLFDAGHYEHLPSLNGLARQPYLDVDGRLIVKSDYDEQSGMYAAFAASRFHIPQNPSREKAMAALSSIRELLSEFAFATPHDEAAALAAILTAVVRPGLKTAPLFHVKASTFGSGKSYLTSVIASFCGPGKPTILTFPTDEAECQKLLISTFMTAPAAVVFDNLTHDLQPYKSLCTALTEEHMTGRLLGVSKTTRVGTRTLMLSSGNNVDAVRDMARRTITITLDPQVENPASRRFEGDPLHALEQQREHFVSMALTVVRAWLAAGSPLQTCQPMNSYNGWSQWVRQPLLWLGLPDPARSSFEQQTQDPDREVLGRVLHAWRGVFGSTPTMIREAVNGVSGGMLGPSASELREAMAEVAEDRGEINRRRLGKWISRQQGRIVDGMKFVRAGGHTSAERWCVKSVSTVSSVSDNAFSTEDSSEVPF